MLLTCLSRHVVACCALMAILSVAAPASAQTKTWDGGAATLSWHDGANWNPDGVPGASDDVLIDVVGTITVTFTTGTTTINSLTCNENLTLSGGTLNISTASSINGVFTLSSGTLGGSGNVTISSSNSVSWSGGTMSGAGRTIIAGSALMSISGSATKTLQSGRVLEVNGSATWDSGSLSVGSASIDIAGTFTIQGASAVTAPNVAGTGAFNVLGTGLLQNANPGANIARQINNAGTVSVSAGVLFVNGGGTSSGTFTVASGAELNFDESHTHAATEQFQGQGLVSFTQGTWTFPSGITFDPLLSILIDGTASVTMNASISCRALDLGIAGGSPVLSGSGNLTVVNQMMWSGGTMSGTGKTIIANGATATLNTATTKTLGRTLENHGIIDWTAGQISHSGGTWDNMVDGVFNASSGSTFANSSGSNRFNNYGIFNKSGANTLTFASGVPFSIFSTGVVNVDTGTLTISSTGSGNDGLISVDAGATINFNAGFSHVATSTITGAGTVTFSTGTNNWPAGGFNPTGTVNFSGGTITINNTFTPSSLGAISSATVNINAAQSWPSLTLSGGTLGGSGDVTIASPNTFIWTGGTMSGTGKTIIANGATLSISGSADRNFQRIIENHGTTTWNGTFELDCTNATFNNMADGVFNVGADGGSIDLDQISGTNVFNNFGQFGHVSLASTTFTSEIAFNNSGDVTIADSILNLSGPGTHIGDFHLFGGSLKLSSSVGHTFQTSSDILGTGSLIIEAGANTFLGTINVTINQGSFSGGTNTFNGPVSWGGGPVNFTGGSWGFSGDFWPTDWSVSNSTVNVAGPHQLGNLTINAGGVVNVNGTCDCTTLSMTGGTLGGTGALTVTSTAAWSGGTMSGSGKTIIGSSAALTISGAATKEVRRTLENNGVMSQTGAGAVMFNLGTLTNKSGGLLNVTAATVYFPFVAGQANLLDNQGIINHNATTGEMFVNGVPFTNSGTLNVNQGTFRVHDLLTNSGVIDVDPGATMRFTSTATHSAGSTLGGSGILLFEGGTHTFPAGTFAASGTINVSGATLSVNNAASATALNISTGTASLTNSALFSLSSLLLSGDGTLQGSGQVTVNTTLNWTGGTMSGSGTTIIAPSATLNISGPGGGKNLRRALQNNGNVSWTDGTILFTNGTLTNNATLTATFVTDNGCATGGIDSFVNNGTINKQGAAVMTIGIPCTNAGSVNVNAGRLDISGGGSHTGDIVVASGSQLRLSGNHTFATSADITGAGNVEWTGGTITHAGTVSISGNATFDSGTTVFNGSFNALGTLLFQLDGTTTIKSTTTPSGTVAINSSSLGTTANFTVPQSFVGLSLGGNGNSTLGGSGNVTVTGTLTWPGGRMVGSGRTIIAPGATATLSSNNNKQIRFGRTLQNDGVINWTDGNLTLQDSTITNNSVFNMNTSTTPQVTSDQISTNAFNNSGNILKSGNGTVFLQAGVSPALFSNTGTVSVASGTLNLSSSVTQYSGGTNTLTGGTWNVATNSTLTFPAAASIRTLASGATVELDGAASNFAAIGGLTTINSGASFELAGGRDFAATPTGGTLTNNGTLTLGPLSNLTITGAYSQGAAGNLNLDYDANSGAALTATTGQSLNGALDVDYVGGFNPTFPSTLTLLSTSGGAVSGTFAAASLPPRANGPLTENTVVYNPTTVALSYAYKPGAFIGDSGETWFDTANWGSGAMPDSSTDVLLNVQVLVDQTGALARTVDVLSGGELRVGNAGGSGSLNVAQTITVETGGTMTLIANGSVIAASLVVQSGATLNLSSSSATLNVLNLTMQSGSILNWTGGTVVIDGGAWSNPAAAIIAIGCSGQAAALELRNSGSVTAQQINLCSMGEARGNGTLVAAVSNAGNLKPGLSAGTITINGDYVQAALGTLTLELGGLTPGTQHDVVSVTGSATLDGDASINLINAFVPQVGNAFNVLSAASVTGEFSGVIGSPTSCGKVFDATYTPTSATINTLYDAQQRDCNNNNVPDACDILALTSPDCNANNVPDECDIASLTSPDCNSNSIPDECDIAANPSIDCNANAIPDSCDFVSGFSVDLNSNTIPDDCEVFDPGDVDGNGVVNADDLLAVITGWGMCLPNLACPADIAPYPDGDGVVDMDDLLATIVNWG